MWRRTCADNEEGKDEGVEEVVHGWRTRTLLGSGADPDKSNKRESRSKSTTLVVCVYAYKNSIVPIYGGLFLFFRTRRLQIELDVEEC